MVDREYLLASYSLYSADKISSMALVMLWWFVSARKWFKGPKINVRPPFFSPNETLSLTLS